MKAIALVVIALLALAPVVSSISCYYGTAGIYYTSSTCDVCTTTSLLSVTTKACAGTGTGSVTCSSLTGVTCCSTNLCNGAKINGVSILMASVAVIVGLFRSL